MKGKILGFDTTDNEGAIKGTDGNRYVFQFPEWKGTGDPKADVPVDFVANDGNALQIYPIRDSEAEDSKLAFGILALLLTFFLSFIGTLISRLALAKQPFSKVIGPVVIHAICTLLFLIPVVGWIVFFLCTIYFMVKNYQLVNKGT